MKLITSPNCSSCGTAYAKKYGKNFEVWDFRQDRKDWHADKRLSTQIKEFEVGTVREEIGECLVECYSLGSFCVTVEKNEVGLGNKFAKGRRDGR